MAFFFVTFLSYFLIVSLVCKIFTYYTQKVTLLKVFLKLGAILNRVYFSKPWCRVFQTSYKYESMKLHNQTCCLSAHIEAVISSQFCSSIPVKYYFFDVCYSSCKGMICNRCNFRLITSLKYPVFTVCSVLQ